MKRRAFDNNIAPLLAGKGVKVGVTLIYERIDLDSAWETYKLSAGEKRSGQEGGKQWGAQEGRVYIRQRMAAAGKSMLCTRGNAFADAVLQVQPKLKIS